MTACPTCGIEPTCTCNVFTPTPGPCRVHGGLLKPLSFCTCGTDPGPCTAHPRGGLAQPPVKANSLDRSIFEHFLHQPDTRSKELM